MKYEIRIPFNLFLEWFQTAFVAEQYNERTIGEKKNRIYITY